MIDLKLKNYIEENIIPIYEQLDKAHKSNHVYNVIESAFYISKNYDVDLNMIYVICAFHDIGLIENREKHHIIGGEMLMNDNFINNYFNNENLTIMKEAVEDHRASIKNPPRSIYGKIIAEADRTNSIEEVIERCILFAVSKNKTYNFEDIFIHVNNHVIDKYGKDGYLKVWLKTELVEKMLFDIRELLKNPKEFKDYCYNIFLKINNKNSKTEKFI